MDKIQKSIDQRKGERSRDEEKQIGDGRYCEKEGVGKTKRCVWVVVY